MEMPVNRFKQSLRAGQRQIGLWTGLAHATCAEICACAGFDWILLDAEHSPNDLQTLQAQLQVLAAYASHPVVRVPSGDPVLIKRVLDLGSQSLLIPAVETADQARLLVRAVQYPPRGIRGVGTATARAARWNSIPEYLARADDEVCLLVQVESVAALGQVEEIARVEGVDGVFVGPADLAASLGYRGQQERPEVQKVIEETIARIRACGKPAGILTARKELARRYIELGCTFVAVGIDTLLLAQAARALVQEFGSAPVAR